MASLATGPADETKTIVISRNLNRAVSRYMPDVVIAIGNNALKRLLDVKTIPVGYLLCTNLDRVKDKDNFFGIATDYDQCALKTVINSHLPGVNTIALLQSPQNNRIKSTPGPACQSDIRVASVTVRVSSELPSEIMKNAKNADAIAVDPDSDMLTQETMEYLFQFSLENQIPLISLRGRRMFSDSAMMLDMDPIANGKAMAGMANDYLTTGKKALKRISNRWFLVEINKRTVKMLKLDVKKGM